MKIVYCLVDLGINKLVTCQGACISATGIQLRRPPEAREGLFLILLERETVPDCYPRLRGPGLDREEFLSKKGQIDVFLRMPKQC